MENSFTGVIGNTIAGAGNLSTLNIANNKFCGVLPNEIGLLDGLIEFSCGNNLFLGSLPASILKLEQLTKLDLHNNGFSGGVPIGLQNLRLNLLTGDIPTVYAKTIYVNIFLGNPGLCGDIEGLCDGKNVTKNVGYVWLLRAIFVLAGSIFIVGFGWFFFQYRKFKNSKQSIDNSKWTLMSFHKLSFSEYEILGALDEDNGGSVTRTLFDFGVVALQKLVNFLPNGSLGYLLHSTKSGLHDWPIRYKIAVDATEGLAYLHHDCVPAIVHRDVKSNNILLDGDFGARVADFGVLSWSMVTRKTVIQSVIAGSCGYIATEYAYTLRVNEKCDIYSFGVVILELVTEKHPIDPEYGEKDLVKWVCTTLDKKV
ncbi:putative transferase, protein kinase RLK-Pelle-LRR-XI-1 family [Helianthus anomalus]